MSEEGYVKAQSDNLPSVDSLMIAEFFSNNSKFTIAEIRGVKSHRAERESYGDAAVGYVQLKRSGNICIVKCQVCPEHRVRTKNYNVVIEIDETEEKIIKAECQDCAASAGGCKHEVAFIMWIHRRSEEVAPTEVACYWKKPKLAGVGTSLKFITIKDFGAISVKQQVNPQDTNFLSEFVQRGEEAKISAQILKYAVEKTPQLGLHQILCDFVEEGGKDFDNFMEFASQKITGPACEEAFRKTTSQSECSLWHDLRYARITASKVYEVARCKSVSGTLVETIIGALKIRESSAMARGKALEAEVLVVLQKKLNIKLKKAGLMLSPKYPIIGASPDGVCGDFVVEIKCPSSKKTVTNYITKENEVAIKYKAQIMLQMLLLNKTKGLFCVADPQFEQNKMITILNVDLDNDFIESIIQQAVQFWKANVFPVLINNN